MRAKIEKSFTKSVFSLVAAIVLLPVRFAGSAAAATPPTARATPATSSDVMPTPKNWKRDALPPARRALFSGEVVQVYSPLRRAGQRIFVLATTLGPTISKSEDGKDAIVDERVRPVEIRSYVTNLIESRSNGLRRIAVSDTQLCNGRPGMRASYKAPDVENGGTMTMDFAAQQSGPYIVDVLYMHEQGVAADPAVLDALKKLCVPGPAILETAFGARAKR